MKLRIEVNTKPINVLGELDTVSIDSRYDVFINDEKCPDYIANLILKGIGREISGYGDEINKFTIYK